MAGDAISASMTLEQAAATLAWPAVRKVQSSPGMAATRAMGGASRQSSGEDEAGREQERVQSRALEMDLIREAQAGSRSAFDALVRQYEHQVLRLALHLTGSEHDAEDIYQEAFLKAYRYIGNFRFECSFYTWIYRIVTNLCLDQLRRRKTRREDHAVVVDRAGDEIDCWLRYPTTGRFPIPPGSWTARCWARKFRRRWASLRRASGWSSS